MQQCTVRKLLKLKAKPCSLHEKRVIVTGTLTFQHSTVATPYPKTAHTAALSLIKTPFKGMLMFLSFMSFGIAACIHDEMTK